MSVNKISYLLEVDKDLSSRLSICGNSNSACGSMRPTMRLLEYSCNGILWLTCISAAILISHRIELHEKLLNLLSALLVDIAIIGLCKLIFKRGRPAENLDDMMTISVDKYSFPSGHASRAVLVIGFIVMQFSLSGLYQALLIVWGFCVCLSRILLGRHHVSDVLCGMALGFVEYHLVISYLWLPRQFCESIIGPIQEDLHL